MEAKNLRIGNLIKYIDKTVICNVDIIYAVSKCIRPTKLYSPIPLTKEWLYKFGFIRNGMECNIPLPLGTGLDLSIEDDGETCIVRRHFCDGVLTSDFDYAYVKHCKYVHELQNLFFALTGTELELKTESSTCG